MDAQLYEYLEHDSRGVELAAARSLEERGNSYPISSIVDTLALQLESRDGGERSRAAQELGRTRSPTAVAPLTAALADDNSEVRLRAVQSLGRTGDHDAVPVLTAALDDPVAEVRSEAARSIDRIRNPQPDRGLGGRAFFGGR